MSEGPRAKQHTLHLDNRKGMLVLVLKDVLGAGCGRKSSKRGLRRVEKQVNALELGRLEKGRASVGSTKETGGHHGPGMGG